MSDAPERIWLQHNNPYDAREENTWADHAVGETEAETEYLRADLIDALLAEAVREGAYNAATEARMAMTVTDQADEYTCSVCAAQIRKWATDETSITEAVKRLKETPDR